MHRPGPIRPQRPARWLAEARLTGSMRNCSTLLRQE
ncbi:Uncharacterised protein [Bordetella pertussis]|nr:Uncharacterised protein [Bordetella pertussis]